MAQMGTVAHLHHGNRPVARRAVLAAPWHKVRRLSSGWAGRGQHRRWQWPANYRAPAIRLPA